MLVSEKVSHTLVKPLLAILCDLQKDDDVRIKQLAEIISEIREPTTVVEHSISSEQRRQIDLKVRI